MINNLTGLRFFVAYWVVIYHVKEAINIVFLSEIVDHGYLGVDIFFILSGYILTHVYYDELFVKIPTKSTNLSFIKKRFARIYPLHFFTLIAAIVFMVSLNKLVGAYPELRYDHILPHLLLIHAWGVVDGLTWNFPSWSVSAEWFAYLFIFPLTHFCYRKGGLLTSVLVTLIILAVYICVSMFFFKNNIGGQLDKGIVRIIPEFFLGSTVYLIYWKGNRSYSFLISLCYALMIVLLYLYTKNFQYSFILMVCPFLIFLHKGNKWLNWFFGNRIIVFLGEISYSIYMLHFFSRAIVGIIQNNFFKGDENLLVYLGIYTSLTIFFSIGAYYLIEIPFRKYINKMNTGLKLN